MALPIASLTQTIDRAVDLLSEALPASEQAILLEIETLLRSLNIRGGKLVQSVENLRALNRIAGRLESAIVNSKDYSTATAKYLSAFSKVEEIQRAYFTKLDSSFTPSKFLRKLQADSLVATEASLLRGGISSNVVAPIVDLVREGIKTGIDYNKLVGNLRQVVVGSPTIEPRLTKYVKQITTDALNQYAASYMEVAAGDLGLEWFDYAGAEMLSSRLFCQAMVKKRYYHVLEIPSLLEGNFIEFKAVKGTINSKTGLPDGMVPTTTPATFNIYRGGFNCRHQAVPIPEANVPRKVRELTYAKFDIAFNEMGYRVAA
jgi:hypothetical protein